MANKAKTITEKAEESAQAHAEAAANNPGETIPGGRYINSSGVLVNCEGQPIEEAQPIEGEAKE